MVFGACRLGDDGVLGRFPWTKALGCLLLLAGWFWWLPNCSSVRNMLASYRASNKCSGISLLRYLNASSESHLAQSGSACLFMVIKHGPCLDDMLPISAVQAGNFLESPCELGVLAGGHGSEALRRPSR